MKHAWRRPAALVAVAALAVGTATASAHHGHGGDTPRGDRLFTFSPDAAGNPEGVAVDKRSGAFFSGVTADGTIYRGTTGQDTLSPFIPGGPGKSALGMKVRHGLLYVAGGSTGTLTVYDLATKAAVATFETGAGGFLNDLVVTGDGDVYVTDSFRPTLWHVTADQVQAGGGTPQALDVSAIPFQGGAFNLNGIVARGERRLVVVDTATGQLFRLDLNRDGDAIDRIDEIDGATVPGGDGMLLDRGRLIVVTGSPAPHLQFVKLRHGARSARLDGSRTSDTLRGPSTIARAQHLYLVVNADFATSQRPFTVAGLDRRGGHGGHGGRR